MKGSASSPPEFLPPNPPKGGLISYAYLELIFLPQSIAEAFD